MKCNRAVYEDSITTDPEDGVRVTHYLTRCNGEIIPLYKTNLTLAKFGKDPKYVDYYYCDKCGNMYHKLPESE